MATSVADLIIEHELNQHKKVRLYNPDIVDFVVKYHGQMVTFHAQEIETFDYDLAQYLKNCLVQHLLGKNGILIPNEEDIKKYQDQVEVIL